MAPTISLDDRNAWDDSALIDSWDEALAEYKKYYSIQAQGKRLEDVLTEEELSELREEHGDLLDEAETKCTIAESNIDAEPDSAGRSGDLTNGQAILGNALTSQEEPAASGHQEDSQATGSALPPQESVPAASMPQALLGTVQDENMKNLMMSWYYAGYYTGLHTGQQQTTPKGQ